MESINPSRESLRNNYSYRPEEIRCINPKVLNIFRKEGRVEPQYILSNDLSKLIDLNERRCHECIYPLSPHVQSY